MCLFALGSVVKSWRRRQRSVPAPPFEESNRLSDVSDTCKGSELFRLSLWKGR